MSHARIPMLRTSERKDFKRCQQRWWWAWREGLRDRGSPSTPLWFGTGIHLALAAWYCGPGTKRGPHPAETWTEFAKDELATVKIESPSEEEVQEYVDASELGRVLMEEYVRHYGTDDHKLIIAPEQTFKLPIPWHDRQQLYDYGSKDLLVNFHGTFDGVWRDAGTGWLILDEHKTAKTISTGHLDIDDQGGGYWAVATMVLRRQGLIGQKESLKGIEYNFIRKALPDTRPKDAEGYATNKPTKADYIKAINEERAKMPTKTGGSWLGPEPTGKESLELLREMASKMGLTVLGERSKVQPKPLFERHMVHRTSKERFTQLQRIQDEAVHMRAIRDGLLPITLNPTRDCQWDCRFHAMCVLKENGGDWKEFKDLQYRQEDPYADHRKSAEE